MTSFAGKCLNHCVGRIKTVLFTAALRWPSYQWLGVCQLVQTKNPIIPHILSSSITHFLSISLKSGDAWMCPRSPPACIGRWSWADPKSPQEVPQNKCVSDQVLNWCYLIYIVSQTYKTSWWVMTCSVAVNVDQMFAHLCSRICYWWMQSLSAKRPNLGQTRLCPGPSSLVVEEPEFLFGFNKPKGPYIIYPNENWIGPYRACWYIWISKL